MTVYSLSFPQDLIWGPSMKNSPCLVAYLEGSGSGEPSHPVKPQTNFLPTRLSHNHRPALEETLVLRQSLGHSKEPSSVAHFTLLLLNAPAGGKLTTSQAASSDLRWEWEAQRDQARAMGHNWKMLYH